MGRFPLSGENLISAICYQEGNMCLLFMMDGVGVVYLWMSTGIEDESALSSHVAHSVQFSSA